MMAMMMINDIEQTFKVAMNFHEFHIGGGKDLARCSAVVKSYTAPFPNLY